MMIDLSDYDKLRKEANDYYSNVGRIYCPVLQGKISFGSEAFNHLIYKNSRNERDKSSQILRFKLLPLAVKLVGLTTTYQEYEETTQAIFVKKRKKNVLVNKVVKYWGLIAIVNGRKIKVIIKKIGDNGDLKFWSVIPAWVTNKYRDVKFFSVMKGNPGED